MSRLATCMPEHGLRLCCDYTESGGTETPTLGPARSATRSNFEQARGVFTWPTANHVAAHLGPLGGETDLSVAVRYLVASVGQAK